MYTRIVDDDGTRHGISHDQTIHLMVFPDGDNEIFQRHAIKCGITGEVSKQVTWLVGSLNGVKLYCMEDGKFVMTTREINP